MLMMSRSVFVLVSFVYVWLEKRSKVEVSSALVSRCVCGLNKCLFWLIFKLVEEFLCGCILLHFEIVNKLMFCFYWIYLIEIWNAQPSRWMNFTKYVWFSIEATKCTLKKKWKIQKLHCVASLLTWNFELILLKVNLN